MSVLTVIFSKDRPLQLQATLASFALQCQEAVRTPIAVLYCASSDDFAAGYAQLREEFLGRLAITWVEERDFKKDLVGLLQGGLSPSRRQRLLQRLLLAPREPSHDNLLFLVDDNIFVRSFSLEAICQALQQEPQVIGFSLRVGRNTTRCYSMDIPQPLPDFRAATHGLRFRWMGQVGDFGYPLEVSSSVYRSADLIGMLRSLPYTNPNRLEQVLSASARLFSVTKPDLLCFEQSVAFCVPINKVQTILNNRAGELAAHSAEELNRCFLNGLRVDVAALDSFVPIAAHQELDLPMIPAQKS
jgi:hypothetical protein